MIKKSILKEIDKAIKNIWLHNICTDYASQEGGNKNGYTQGEGHRYIYCEDS